MLIFAYCPLTIRCHFLFEMRGIKIEHVIEYFIMTICLMCVEGKLKRINVFHFDRLKKNGVYNNNNFESNFIHGVVLFFATVAKCTHADIS